MKLNFTQIKNITFGAVSVTQEEQGISFSRFTKEQIELYDRMKPIYNEKVTAASGIKLHFKTDSRKLFLKMFVIRAGRPYFALDVTVNGELLGSITNYSHLADESEYFLVDFREGEFVREFDLGEGEKTVCIYLPWSAKVILQEFSLDEGAKVEPVTYKGKMLNFGDSITQGYDSANPTRKPITRLGQALGLEEHNKAIGGEKFFPELALTKEDFVPELITVAYGTNDWSSFTQEEFTDKCNSLFQNLRKTYPDTPIYAITPIWRKDCDEMKKVGRFSDLHRIISEAVSKIGNAKVIPGIDLVPHDTSFYADLRLHPNNKGFEHYFNNLITYFK